MGKQVAARVVVADHVQLALGLEREVHPDQERVLHLPQDVPLRHGVHHLAFVRDFLMWLVDCCVGGRVVVLSYGGGGGGELDEEKRRKIREKGGGRRRKVKTNMNTVLSLIFESLSLQERIWRRMHPTHSKHTPACRGLSSPNFCQRARLLSSGPETLCQRRLCPPRPAIQSPSPLSPVVDVE